VFLLDKVKTPPILAVCACIATDMSRRSSLPLVESVARRLTQELVHSSTLISTTCQCIYCETPRMYSRAPIVPVYHGILLGSFNIVFIIL
jgi:hypothetical protein